MAFVYRKSGSPYWYAAWTVNGRRRGDRSTKQLAKRLAQDIADDWERSDRGQDRDEQPVKERPIGTPLAAAVAEFVAHLRRSGATEKAVKNDISRLRVMFGIITPDLSYLSPNRAAPTPMLRGSDVRDVTATSINRSFDALPAGTSPKSINNMREMLYRFFSYVRRHIDPTLQNPVEDVPCETVPDQEIEFLELDDIDRWLAACRGDDRRALIATLCYTSMRRSEAVWLRVEDVDTRSRGFRIRPKAIDGRAWKPKTGRARWVPISDRLWSVLEPHLAQRHSGWLFRTERGAQWSPDGITHMVARMRGGVTGSAGRRGSSGTRSART